eukprot:TRINITY_DN12786_c0_g1_i1.p1 TRINITY_DN12786_c0_g1~~TRINITY_DN12786_c0_g1_i1.p1  ORF type:complete len:204 (-),score=54.67 TRINITY_DN12786_c0_g1_i1:223-834(-)
MCIRDRYMGILYGVQDAINFCFIYYLITAYIAMSMAFFVSLVSSIQHIEESRLEIAVLRAVGLNKFKMLWIYIYESLALTLAAAFIGLMVGMIVAFMVDAQLMQLVELPVYFEIPWEYFMGCLACALVISVLVPTLAMRNMYKKSIAASLKSLEQTPIRDSSIFNSNGKTLRRQNENIHSTAMYSVKALFLLLRLLHERILQL